jgi:hypothetical protein
MLPEPDPGVGPLCRSHHHTQCTGYWDPGQQYETYGRHRCTCPHHEDVAARLEVTA